MCHYNRLNKKLSALLNYLWQKFIVNVASNVKRCLKMSIKRFKSKRSDPDWEAFFFGNDYKEPRIFKIVRRCKFLGISTGRDDLNDNAFANEIFRPIASEVELERRIVERLKFYAIVVVMFLQLLETCISFLM